ncbi:MAG: toll/interleukin-1 receptor domain-containing protein [Nitrospirae bacterium]|nr:toll/interleukin-1 receptor domain-containing protein [Nitrospirota bacterium]
MSIIRSAIFISYSHKDKVWLERLKIHLKPLERDFQIEVWEDTRIQPGARWKKEIMSMLQRTKVAILMISPDFLASDFIAAVELPFLLKAAENDGALVLPILLSWSLFMNYEELSQFQAVNSTPLVMQQIGEQDAVFVRVAETILSSGIPKRKAANLITPDDQNVSQGSNTSFLISDILDSTLKEHNIDSTDFMTYVKQEFNSHIILYHMDYESLLVPLKNGFYCVVSKLGNTVTIEHASNEIPHKSIHEALVKLNSAYFAAYSLPFRRDHTLLLRDSEYKKSYNAINNLFLLLHEYYMSFIASGRRADEHVRNMHILKGICAYNMLKADHLYHREAMESNIGEVAISFDLVISSIHKVLLDHPKNSSKNC